MSEEKKGSGFLQRLADVGGHFRNAKNPQAHIPTSGAPAASVEEPTNSVASRSGDPREIERGNEESRLEQAHEQFMKDIMRSPSSKAALRPMVRNTSRSGRR